jgi:uncharacterized protein YdhG (YjbR/CyaY superfamily)
MAPPASVDEYIAAQPPAAQVRLRELRAIIREAVPQAAELISYGMPTYKLGRWRVHVGAARHHCALYGAPLAAFPDDLRGYDTTRGTLRFPLDQPIPTDLVRKLLLARLEPPG